VLAHKFSLTFALLSALSFKPSVSRCTMLKWHSTDAIHCVLHSRQRRRWQHAFITHGTACNPRSLLTATLATRVHYSRQRWQHAFITHGNACNTRSLLMATLATRVHYSRQRWQHAFITHGNACNTRSLLMATLATRVHYSRQRWQPACCTTSQMHDVQVGLHRRD
jgi:hypothetical protein